MNFLLSIWGGFLFVPFFIKKYVRKVVFTSVIYSCVCPLHCQVLQLFTRRAQGEPSAQQCVRPVGDWPGPRTTCPTCVQDARMGLGWQWLPLLCGFPVTCLLGSFGKLHSSRFEYFFLLFWLEFSSFNPLELNIYSLL